jgi:hypothetical protein
MEQGELVAARRLLSMVVPCVETLLRTYAHVIRQDEDRVRAIVDVTLGGDAEDWLSTEVV